MGRLRFECPSPLARMVLIPALPEFYAQYPEIQLDMGVSDRRVDLTGEAVDCVVRGGELTDLSLVDRKSTRLNSSHVATSDAVFCLRKKNKTGQEVRVEKHT